jgi:hypothetical protein
MSGSTIFRGVAPGFFVFLLIVSRVPSVGASDDKPPGHGDELEALKRESQAADAEQKRHSGEAKDAAAKEPAVEALSPTIAH